MTLKMHQVQMVYAEAFDNSPLKKECGYCLYTKTWYYVSKLSCAKRLMQSRTSRTQLQLDVQNRYLLQAYNVDNENPL